MVSKYQAGSQAYLIESNRIIREVTVVSCRSDFYIVRFAGNSGNGGIQIRGSRLFPTREDAEQRFLAYDQEKMIRKFQLEADEAFLYLRFVGRDYRINRKNGKI